MSLFQKASKKQSKLRLAIFGPSGAGKTYTALSLAQGIAGENGKIAVIDTERDSASLYADRFDFDHANLLEPTLDQYIQFMSGANEYDVLIIDSITHGWQSLLEEIDQLANAKYKGNTFRAWAEGTPKQRKFVDAILRFPNHIIATMRSKTEWTADNSSGKMSVNRVGLTPEQGKGIEYEFTLLMEISTDHTANIIKDRTGKFQDKLISKPDSKLGEQLKEWLNSGVPSEFYTTLRSFCSIYKKNEAEAIQKILEKRKAKSLDSLEPKDFEKIIADLKNAINAYYNEVEKAKRDKKNAEFFATAKAFGAIHEATPDELKLYVKTFEQVDSMNELTPEQLQKWVTKMKSCGVGQLDSDFLVFLNQIRAEQEKESKKRKEPILESEEEGLLTQEKPPTEI